MPDTPYDRVNRARALRLETPGWARVVDQALPADDTARAPVLQVLSAALCRTDARMWQCGHRDLVLPRVLGHEVCVRDECGRRYALWPGVSCGHCRACRSGVENLCPEVSVLGFHRDGGLAEWVQVPWHSLVPVPEEVPDTVACLAEPLACGINALHQAAVRAGDRVLIYGAGPVGLLLALAARSWGAQPLVIELDAGKAARSERFQERSSVAVTLEEPGPGWDVAINAVSQAVVVSDGLRRLRPGGRYVVFSGLPEEPRITAALNEVHYRQLQVVGAFGCTRAGVVEAVALLARYPRAVAALIEAVIPLEAVPDALPRVAHGGVLRFVVQPAGID